MSRKVPATQLCRREVEVLGDEELHEIIIEATSDAAKWMIKKFNVRSCAKGFFKSKVNRFVSDALDRAAVASWPTGDEKDVEKLRELYPKDNY